MTLEDVVIKKVLLSRPGLVEDYDMEMSDGKYLARFVLNKMTNSEFLESISIALEDLKEKEVEWY